MRTKLLIATAAFVSAGCYQYFPVDDTAPLPETGAEVRIQLESPQSLELGTMTLNDVSTVEGHIYESESDTLSIFSSKLRTFYGFRQYSNGAVFYFDRSQFRSLEQRKMVVWKTAIVTAGLSTGAIALMYYGAGWGRGGQSGRQNPPPPGFDRVTVVPVSIPIQW